MVVRQGPLLVEVLAAHRGDRHFKIQSLIRFRRSWPKLKNGPISNRFAFVGIVER
jgi:hypothetical protein